MVGRGVAMGLAVLHGVAAVAGAGECAWQWVNPMPPRVDILRANTLQHRTVAVGEEGTVLVTDDGARWRRVAAPTAATLRGIDWGAGRWVAVGDGVVLSSASADQWSLEAELPGVSLRDVDFGAARFVAVGDGLGGDLVTSGDGRTWSRVAVGWSTGVDSIHWIGDRFVAAAGAEIWSSSDGLSWQRVGEVPVAGGVVAAGAEASRVDLAFDGARVFWGGAMQVFRSTDLAAWDEVLRVDSCAQFSGLLGLYAETGLVIASAVAVCPTPYLDPQAQLSSSRDGGATWSLDWDELGGGFPALARTLSGWVGLGLGGDLVSSGNARTWSCLWGACSSAACADGLSAVVHRSDDLVAVGGVGLCDESAKRLGGGTVATSADGSRWDTFAVDGEWLHDLASDGERLVGVWDEGVLWSDDGDSWQAGEGAASAHLRSVAWAGSSFIGVGDGGLLVISDSGTSWQTGFSGTTADLARVVWDGELVHLLGARGELLASDDALNWSRVASLGNATLRGLVRGVPGWVVVGDGGTVLHSPDLVRWTAPSPGLPVDLELVDVAWGQGLYVAIGTRGRGAGARPVVLASDSGLEWTRYEPSGAGLPRRLLAVEGGWIVVGSERTLLWSTCGALRGRPDPAVATVPPGAAVEVELRFDRPLDETLTVAIASSAPTVVSVPATLVVPRGFDRTRIRLTGHGVLGDATVTASWPSDWGTASVDLLARVRSGLWTRPGGRRVSP